MRCVCFILNDTTTTEIYTLALHDALPICRLSMPGPPRGAGVGESHRKLLRVFRFRPAGLRAQRADQRADEIEILAKVCGRSEEHTSELQSRSDVGCRLLHVITK